MRDAWNRNQNVNHATIWKCDNARPNHASCNPLIGDSVETALQQPSGWTAVHNPDTKHGQVEENRLCNEYLGARETHLLLRTSTWAGNL